MNKGVRKSSSKEYQGEGVSVQAGSTDGTSRTSIEPVFKTVFVVGMFAVQAGDNVV